MGTILILLKLLSAHIIADFFLQFDRLCQGKQEKGVNGIIAQAIHALIHAICAYLLLADWTQWLIPVVILVTHFIIDTINILFNLSIKSAVIDGFRFSIIRTAP